MTTTVIPDSVALHSSATWSWQACLRATAVEWTLLAYALVAHWYATTTGVPIPWQHTFFHPIELAVASVGAPLIFVLATVLLALSRRCSLRDAGRETYGAVRSVFASRLRLLDAARLILGVKITIALYNGIKQKIPLVNPVLFDGELDMIDQWLTLGWSPFELLHGLLGWTPVMRFIDVMYVVWILLQVPMFLVFACHPCARTRWHFFFSYNLMWIILGGCAAVIPSVGPCYIIPERFAEVEMPLARQVQAALWDKYRQMILHPTVTQESLYKGVAAFPSLHVAVAFYFALATRRWKAAHIVLSAYAVTIFCGSVLLGWHYAIDGYFSIVVVTLIYFGVARAMGVTPWRRTSGTTSLAEPRRVSA